jgi:hypothetical protein
VWRQLSLISTSIRFDEFRRRVTGYSGQTLAANVQQWATSTDKDFRLFFNNTCQESGCLPLLSRIGMAYYLADGSPRLYYLLAILRDQGFLFDSGQSTHPKIIVFTHWPASTWLVQMFMLAPSLDFASITADMDETSRAEAVSRFTSPGSCSVLVTTYASRTETTTRPHLLSLLRLTKSKTQRKESQAFILS